MTEGFEPDDWSPEAVLGRLALAAKGNAPVSAQIVLSETIAAGDMASATQISLINAARDLGIDAGQVHVGVVYELAHAIGVTAPVPVLRKIMTEAAFAQIMPGNLSLDEVMISPVDKLG